MTQRALDYGGVTGRPEHDDRVSLRLEKAGERDSRCPPPEFTPRHRFPPRPAVALRPSGSSSRHVSRLFGSGVCRAADGGGRLRSPQPVTVAQLIRSPAVRRRAGRCRSENHEARLGSTLSVHSRSLVRPRTGLRGLGVAPKHRPKPEVIGGRHRLEGGVPQQPLTSADIRRLSWGPRGGAVKTCYL